MDTTQQNRDSRLKKKQNENNVDSEMRRGKDWKRKSFMVEDKREKIKWEWAERRSSQREQMKKINEQPKLDQTGQQRIIKTFSMTIGKRESERKKNCLLKCVVCLFYVGITHAQQLNL